MMASSQMPDSEAQPVDGADFDLWYVGVMLMVLSTLFGALGNVCIKQSFNVQASADADSPEWAENLPDWVGYSSIYLVSAAPVLITIALIYLFWVSSFQ